MKTVITKNDSDYKTCVNARDLYNNPVTLTHDGVKYMLSCGSSDSIKTVYEDDYIYVISSNAGLGYLSLQVINTNEISIDGEIYLDNNDMCNEENMCYQLIDKDTAIQKTILSEYI